MTPRGRTRLVIVLIYLAAVAASVQRAETKQDALGFHTRDYPFYLQFATKLLDSEIEPKVYSVNPDGYNVLFFNGTDGAEGLHQSLHLEPFKYLYAVVYYATGSARPIYAFIAIVFFLPMLYLAWMGPLDRFDGRCFVVALSVLYAIWPASLATAAFDLRPFVFLAPFFALTMMSLEFNRPVRETAALFAGMFLAREEALVFGLIVIAYAFLRRYQSPRRNALVLWLSGIWAVSGALIAAYFAWTGYRNTLTPRIDRMAASLVAHPAAALGVLFVMLAAVVGAIAILVPAYRRWSAGRDVPGSLAAQVVVYCAVFPPLAMQFVRERSEMLASVDTMELLRVISSGRFGLHMAAAVVLSLILWRFTTLMRQRVAIIALVWVVIAASVAVNVAAPFGHLGRLSVLRSQSRSAADVIAFRNETDKYRTEILADYATLQAFADYEHVYTYERLPWAVVPGPRRFFPANHALVQELVDRRVEYVVMSKGSLEEIHGILAKSRLRMTTEFENADFIALHLWRN